MSFRPKLLSCSSCKCLLLLSFLDQIVGNDAQTSAAVVWFER